MNLKAYVLFVLCFLFFVTPWTGGQWPVSDGFCHNPQMEISLPKPVDDPLNSNAKAGVDEKLGQIIPLDSVFKDENGRTLRLKDMIDRPVVFIPAYYHCPKSCSLGLSNLAVALRSAPMVPGKDYRVISLSFNDEETPAIAQKAKHDYMGLLPRNFPENEWFFLTGTKKNIHAVLDALGYGFKKDESGSYVHPNALIIIAGNGKIIRYIYGSTYLGADIAMGISEARSGTPSVSVKRILSFCFNYDPKSNRFVFKTLNISAIIIGICFALFVLFVLRKKNQAK